MKVRGKVEGRGKLMEKEGVRMVDRKQDGKGGRQQPGGAVERSSVV